MLDSMRTSVASGGPILIMVVAALAALLLFWGITLALGRVFDPGRRRLQEIATGGTRSSGSTLGQQIAELMRPIERFVMPQGEEREGTRQRLRFAGFASSSAVTTFYGVKLASAAALGLLWLLIAHFLPSVGSGRVLFFLLASSFSA